MHLFMVAFLTEEFERKKIFRNFEVISSREKIRHICKAARPFLFIGCAELCLSGMLLCETVVCLLK